MYTEVVSNYVYACAQCHTNVDHVPALDMRLIYPLPYRVHPRYVLLQRVLLATFQVSS